MSGYIEVKDGTLVSEQEYKKQVRRNLDDGGISEYADEDFVQSNLEFDRARELRAAKRAEAAKAKLAQIEAKKKARFEAKTQEMIDSDNAKGEMAEPKKVKPKELTTEEKIAAQKAWLETHPF